LPVIIEGIAREQDNVRTRRRRRGQNLGKHCKGIRVAEAIVYTKMQIRTVNDNRFWERTHGQIIPKQSFVT
jgi:hypothetical protein